MTIDEKNAKEFFLKQYPSGIGYDFAGRKMNVCNYGNSKVLNGWNIDHKLPVSKRGTDDVGNLQCTNIETNEIKGDKTTWKDGSTWQVQKGKGKKKTYKVVKIEQ